MKEFADWVRADATRKDELASVAFLQFIGWTVSLPVSGGCGPREGLRGTARKSRTANPIGGVSRPPFGAAPYRRNKRSPRSTARLTVFKLIMAAAKTWLRLKGENQVPKVIAGVAFPTRRRKYQPP